MKITALTSCCVDIYPGLDKIYVGGNSLNFATQCKLSGISDVSIIGAVGNDKYGKRIEQHLDNCEIQRTHLYRIDKDTASNKIYINQQGDRYFKEDSWNGGAFDVFRLSENDWELLESSDIIAMPAGDPNLKELLKRRKHQLVIIDFLDYFSLGFIEQMIDSIDVTFISANEEMLDSLNTLARKSGKMIVATLGSKGSVAFHDNLLHFQDSIKVDEIIDTTGCGDAFQAAFVIELYRTGNIKKALSKGAIAAEKILGFVGGVE
jgi:fructoselysine 6-kinase